MRVLVLGGGGMLGHKMFQTLSASFPDTLCTLRDQPAEAPWSEIGLFGDAERVVGGVDVQDLSAVDALLEGMRPDVVVNCVGVIKQRAAAGAAIPSVTINALLPHRLASALRSWGGWVIHFSTDCVFSGRRGDYTEDDFADARDLYGRTKYLGEVDDENALTLRTSIIGRELRHHRSLLDWFLSQEGKQIYGYRRAWWSGVTTNHLSDLVGRLIRDHPALNGVYQVSSGKISKYDLLLKIREGYGLDVEIQPDDEFFCDRSLLGERFAAAVQYQCPTWDEMIQQLVNDPTPYEEWADADDAS